MNTTPTVTSPSNLAAEVLTDAGVTLCPLHHVTMTLHGGLMVSEAWFRTPSGDVVEYGELGEVLGGTVVGCVADAPNDDREAP